MEERILNTIFIHMSRNVIGYLLEIISCIAHRNTGAASRTMEISLPPSPKAMVSSIFKPR